MGERPRARPSLVFLLLAAVSVSLALRAWLRPAEGHRLRRHLLLRRRLLQLPELRRAGGARGVRLPQQAGRPGAPPGARQPRVARRSGGCPPCSADAPLLAYRLFGLAALAALVLGADRLARPLRPPAPTGASRACCSSARAAASAACSSLLGRLPGERALDVRTGAFPFVEALANPHFVAGTALLLAALSRLRGGPRREGRRARDGARPRAPLRRRAPRRGRGPRRPPDRAAPGAWPRRLLPVAGPRARARVRRLALPRRAPASRPSRAPATRPRPRPRATSRSPSARPLLLALLAIRRAGSARAPGTVSASPCGPPSRSWSCCCARSRSPCSSSSASALPLLALAAVGLARLPRGVLEAAVPLMATTAVVVTWLCATPGPPVARAGRAVARGRRPARGVPSGRDRAGARRTSASTSAASRPAGPSSPTPPPPITTRGPRPCAASTARPPRGARARCSTGRASTLVVLPSRPPCPAGSGPGAPLRALAVGVR